MRALMIAPALILVVILASLFGSVSFASGYSCLSVDRDMQAIVYLHAKTDELSTQTLQKADKVVFIDPTLSAKNRVIAIFSEDDQVLSTSALSNGTRYTGEVDMNVPALSHAGKRLGGTKIGLLQEVALEIQTVSEQHKIQMFTEGSMYAGQVTYLKKTGQTLTQDFDCSLFLGDEAPVVDLEH